ncbi:MAG: IS1634 family transposase [Chromatiaceae bacterium]|jgi:transposase|nr:IS1634 family transposase [Candidatus Thioaporhodococcus sediminis]
MFLRVTRRRKDGKVHQYWSIVENRRLPGGRVLQRHVLYLGEINSSQERAWRKSVEVFDERAEVSRSMALFAEERRDECGVDDAMVRLRLSQLRLCHPRVWGSCWLTLKLWEMLALDQFWAQCLCRSRKGTRWDQVLFVLVAYRLLSPGSEWRLHRQWFERSALADLLGADASVSDIHKLYACHDRLLAHKNAVFDHLVSRWRDLFNVEFDLLLYDLTSTYFEANPPFDDEDDKRRFGYSRDKRPDCVQVVIALVVTPEGLPLAYEVLPGNTADKTTLRDFLDRIEGQYGKARRVWVMDRGIPTEETLEQMRHSDPPVHYLVGTPKGRLTKLEQALLLKPWQDARPGVQVKLLPQDGELYVFAQSTDRIAKERAMRRRQLRRLWARLKQLSGMTLTHKELLMRLGAARSQYPSAWRLVEVKIDDRQPSFSYRLNRDKLKQIRRREGRYLLRTNLTGTDPSELWRTYIQLTQVEEAFRNLKGDLALRPIYHQKEARIEAHIFIAFLAYCLHVTLAQQLRPHAPGLTPRSVLDKFAAVQMLDVEIPTTDGRTLRLTRYTEPEADLKLLLEKLRLELPAQPPPKITAAQAKAATPV